MMQTDRLIEERISDPRTIQTHRKCVCTTSTYDNNNPYLDKRERRAATRLYLRLRQQWEYAQQNRQRRVLAVSV